jgi:hypothetical protein
MKLRAEQTARQSPGCHVRHLERSERSFLSSMHFITIGAEKFLGGVYPEAIEGPQK